MIVQNKDLRAWQSKSFGERLREVRKLHNMTQKDVHLASGGCVSEANIKALESNPNQTPHPGTKSYLIGIFIELADNFIPDVKLNGQKVESYPRNSGRTILVPQ